MKIVNTIQECLVAILGSTKGEGGGDNHWRPEILVIISQTVFSESKQIKNPAVYIRQGECEWGTDFVMRLRSEM